MTQLGGHAIYLTEDTSWAPGESGPRRRPQPRAVRRRDRGPDGPARGRRRARRAGVDPGDQRPDAPRASLPGARRPVHDPRAVRRRPAGVVLAFVGDGNNVYHSLALVGATLGMEVRSPTRRATRRTSGSSSALGPRRSCGGAAGVRLGPAGVGPRRGVVYTDAWTSMGQEAETEERRDAFRGFRVERRCSGGRPETSHALPAGPPRRGDHLRGDGRPAQHHLGPVGEPPPRPEGPAGRVIGG